ncbi:MAG: terminase large subunit [Phycisphaerae bacterium]|nr:terminase large subunit [Phycisphaerae bacterium]
MTTARWAGEPFDLQAWQIAIVGNIHGWRRKSDGTRRYRKALITTARKSSKSHIAAGLAVYHLFAEGEADPSIVVAAGSAEQASIIQSIASKMVQQEPELARRCEVMARAIRHLTNGGSMRFVNSAAGTKHGTNESLVILDELHVIEDPELSDVLETSMRSRKSPLTVYTTTAGTDPAALWAEVFDYANKVRSGALNDAEFLPCMWQAGEEDDIKDVATWRKAQPNLGVSVSEDEYRRDLQKALATPRYLPVFKQLSLNLPTESHAAWIDYQQWQHCAGDVEPVLGATAFGGCDLASTQDTTAFVMAFPAHDDRVLVKPFIFLPEENASGLFKRQKRDKAPYRQWADAGHLILTPGNVIDFDRVAEVIIEQANLFDLREVQMDPHAASSIATKLQAAGINVVYVRQGWSLSQACKATEAMIHAGKLVHGNSPVLNWQISNAVVHTDRLENIWLDKARSTRRIDAAVSLVMAINAMKFGGGQSAEPTKHNAPWTGEVLVI